MGVWLSMYVSSYSARPYRELSSNSVMNEAL